MAGLTDQQFLTRLDKRLKDLSDSILNRRVANHEAYIDLTARYAELNEFRSVFIRIVRGDIDEEENEG